MLQSSRCQAHVLHVKIFQRNMPCVLKIVMCIDLRKNLFEENYEWSPSQVSRLSATGLTVNPRGKGPTVRYIIPPTVCFPCTGGTERERTERLRFTTDDDKNHCVDIDSITEDELFESDYQWRPEQRNIISKLIRPPRQRTESKSRHLANVDVSLSGHGYVTHLANRTYPAGEFLDLTKAWKEWKERNMEEKGPIGVLASGNRIDYPARSFMISQTVPMSSEILHVPLPRRYIEFPPHGSNAPFVVFDYLDNSRSSFKKFIDAFNFSGGMG
jgi:hypothetical protein